VSHELKTPLSAIQGSVSAMLEDPLDDRQRELTGIIAESSERLQQTVENMLDMSRIESGMLKPCLEVHDVCDVVNGPLRELAGELKDFVVILKINESIPIRCDMGLTQIVVRNILRNACRYTPKGSEIQIQTIDSEDWVEIQICDNGPGLPDPKRVFEKFYRGNPKSMGGVGLGLSIARRFLEVQNGTLEAENAHGAVFRLRLPKGNL
jgi:two-component system sensor histidine kinase KdpD